MQISRTWCWLPIPVGLFVLASAACGGDRTRIEGSLADPAALGGEGLPGWVSLGEGAERIPLENGRFALQAPDTGTLALTFGAGDDTGARLRLDGVPPDAEVRLEEIWVDRRGRAFPGRVELRGAELVVVNGLRMGATDRLPAQLEGQAATVLATADRGRALLLRSVEPRHPDLTVRADSAVEAVTPDGRPGSLARLGFGDSVSVEARRDGTQFLASRLVVPRPEEPLGVPANPRGGSDGSWVGARPGVRVYLPPAGSEMRRETEEMLRDVRQRGARQDDDAGEDHEKEERRGKGKGRGRGRQDKGKGRHDDR